MRVVQPVRIFKFFEISCLHSQQIPVDSGYKFPFHSVLYCCAHRQKGHVQKRVLPVSSLLFLSFVCQMYLEPIFQLGGDSTAAMSWSSRLNVLLYSIVKDYLFLRRTVCPVPLTSHLDNQYSRICIYLAAVACYSFVHAPELMTA